MTLRIRVIERPSVRAASRARGLAPHAEVLSEADPGRADVAVVDLGTAPDAPIARLARTGERVLALSPSAEPALVAAAIRSGAEGFLVALEDFAQLAQAARDVAAGRNVYGPEVAKAFADPDADVFEVVDPAEWELAPVRAEDEPSQPGVELSDTLSPREAQILKMVATGHSSLAIANALSISVPTVRKHRENLMRKLGLHNVAEVTAFALRRDLLAGPERAGVT